MNKIIEKDETVVGMYQGKKVVSIHGTNVESVQEVVEHFEEAILRQREDHDNNYGLLFYCCGYNGRAQQEVAEYYRETYGVYVF